MELVDCTEIYWNFVRNLRNDPLNQIGFFSEVYITEEEQQYFMKKNHHNYNICLLNGVPVGYVGIINGNEITFCVENTHQGKGIGTFMVEEFSKKYANIISYVKPENIASMSVFRKLGWDEKVYFQKKK